MKADPSALNDLDRDRDQLDRSPESWRCDEHQVQDTKRGLCTRRRSQVNCGKLGLRLDGTPSSTPPLSCHKLSFIDESAL
jgi:hypothetical protein